MVLESFLNPAAAKRHPIETFFLGVLYSVIGLFLAYWVFRDYSSLTLVFLITLAAAPLLYFTVASEERADAALASERAILKEHSKVFLFLMSLFLGITVSLALLYVFLPADMVSVLFSSQTQTIASINNQISGAAAARSDIFLRIFLNNVRVLIFSILFSLLYGIGALFILTWNASVIAAAIGNSVRSHLASYAQAIGLEKLGGYLHVFSFGFLRYALHGLPEVFAYFVGGLAGGILSVALIRNDLIGEKRERILLDVAGLILLAAGALLIAAFLEVYVTPFFF